MSLAWLPLAAGDTIAGPVGLLGTTLHELGHAVVALVTGAHVDGMVVRSDGSGTTYVSGLGGDTVAFAISSAGYLATLVWGAMFVVAGRSTRVSRTAFIGVGALLALTAVIWMDGVFAFLASLALGAACVLVGVVGSPKWLGIAATILGGVFAFTALSDIANVDSTDITAAAFTSGLGTSTVRVLWLAFGVAVVGGAVAVRVISARRQPRAPTDLGTP